MNRDHVKGSLKQAKGKVKEEVGHLTGNERTSLKGVAEQVAGKVQKKLGDFKDAVKDKVDNLLDSDAKISRSKN